MESKWYEVFFHGLALDLWRNVISEEQTLEEALFIADVLKLGQGASILDVPCGMGRHSFELARLGYRVTGLDLSEESVAQARSQAHATGLTIDWILADMTQVDKVCGEQQFDGAFCFGNSFGYADYQTTIEFLLSVSRSLKRGAGFLLDTGLAAESLLPTLQTRRWLLVRDTYFLSEATYDASSSRLQTRYTFIRDNVVQKGTATYFIYTVAELKRLFAMCDLTVESLYGTTKKDEYALGTRLLLVSRKL
jgi:SAM-dependent methyltransferase